MVIQQVSLDHPGGFYHYRVHQAKLDTLCNNGNNFKALQNFLDTMFTKCPDHLFGKGPRSSALKFPLEDTNIIEITGHEVSALAKVGLEANKERYKTAHSQVQVFKLENDQSTIAMEVPIWLTHLEIENYYNLFKTREALTGHIDVLRIEGDKIWVWDYKPKAHKEKYASTQVYFYALMLSKRTGIPLEHFRCGYYDADKAYLFKPIADTIKTSNSKISDFF